MVLRLPVHNAVSRDRECNFPSGPRSPTQRAHVVWRRRKTQVSVHGRPVWGTSCWVWVRSGRFFVFFSTVGREGGRW